MSKDANNNADSSSAGTENDANASSTSGDESKVVGEETSLDLVSDLLDEVDGEAEGNTADDNGEDGPDQEEETHEDEDDSDSEDEDDSEDDSDEDDDEDEDSTEDTEDESEEGEEEEDTEELDEKSEEYHKDPRFKKLIDQKNEYKAEVSELKNQLETQQPIMDTVNAIGAENMKDFTSFLILKDQNPAEALKMIQPMVQELLVDSGHVLSPELRKQVEEGEITEEAAKVIQKKEAEIKALKNQKEADTSVAKSEAEQQEDLLRKEAANNWEKQKLKTDPDFARKKKLILTAMRAEFATNGKPKAAIFGKFLDGIYADVTQSLQGFGPSKKKRKVVKKSTVKKKGKAKKQFKSTKDIIDAELG